MGALIPTQTPKPDPSDLYAVLGVARNVSVEHIRRAYKKAAHEHHPDRGGDVETFKAVKQAYEVLSDPERRQAYDATGIFEGADAVKVETAQSIVSARVQAIIQDQDVDLMYVDIVSYIKEQLQADINSCQKGLKTCKKSMKRLKKGRKRAKAGLIRHVFDENIKALEKAEQQIRDDSELLSLALKIAGTCGYEFDERPVPEGLLQTDSRGHIVFENNPAGWPPGFPP